MSVGQLIKDARKKSNMTQEQLANSAGIATITLRQYETEKRQPKMQQLIKIANALKISMSYFIMGDSFETSKDEYVVGEKEESILRGTTMVIETLFGSRKRESVAYDSVSVSMDIYGEGSNAIALDDEDIELIANTVEATVSSLVKSLARTVEEERATLEDFCKQMVPILEAREREDSAESLPNEAPQNDL